MSVLLRNAKGLVLAALGGVLAAGLLPAAGWASCLWVDYRRMDPPSPGRDGLVMAANRCPHAMRFAFGAWTPATGAVELWSEKLPADGDTGSWMFLSVKPGAVLAATPCVSDCRAEADLFRARRRFSPAQTVIWPPARPPAPP